MSFFERVELLPEDPILGLASLFRADPHEKKVNLGIGVYHDASGKPCVLSSVSEAEEILLKQPLSKQYLPIEGNQEYLKETLKLVYGHDSPLFKTGNIVAAQSVGGCGALRLGADLLVQETSRTVFISDPSWNNHQGIFGRSGLKVRTYPYYDQAKHQLDFSGLCSAVKSMSPGSIILLHPCCHNPSGMDLSFDEWKELSDLIRKQTLFPFFDFAYQGFAEGIEEDARTIRYFASEGHEMAVAQSFSKNFGLYGERVGVISFVTHHAETAKKILSQLKQIIRQTYSNPPLHGANIVTTILSTPFLKAKWVQDVQKMRLRIREIRKSLTTRLAERLPHKYFGFLDHQQGLFSFSGLTKEQVMRLREENGIYLLANGRMNVSGLNPGNIDYTIDAFVSMMNS